MQIHDKFVKYADAAPPKIGSFREQFLTTPPGPAREELVYQAAIKQPLPKLVPVTVTGPNGIKLTYRVLPDYLMIEGLRVPCSGVTAQRIADHFGMHLPTTKMSKQIWNAADTKIKPMPMSGGANIGGKWYSGQEVVDHKINSSDTSVAFNEKIDQEIGKSDKSPRLIAGHMKDISAPTEGSSNLHLIGWYDASGKPIQGGNGITPHDPTQHSEYAAGTRLVSDKITITTPDGKKIGPITMDELLKNPQYKEYASMIYTNPGAGPAKYDTGKTPKPSVQTKPVVAPKAPKVDRNQLEGKINQFLEQVSRMF